MSRKWKRAPNGEENFINTYNLYKKGFISLTECAYLQGISVMGLWKRIRYYETYCKTNYEKVRTSKEIELMVKIYEKYTNIVEKYPIEYKAKLNECLIRTCYYILDNKEEIRDEKKLVYFSLKRKFKDLYYEKHHTKNFRYDDKRRYQ